MPKHQPASRRAADGSPYPDRQGPTFERDVRQMFAFIAPHYQTFNHLATFGQDFVWRARALWELDRFRTGPIVRALDVGCGTGEFARALLARHPRAEVVATDPTGAMVRRASTVRGSRDDAARSAFARADALALPFGDGTFDLVTNAFVLRNLASLSRGLAEMRRVLKPGGVLVSLEIGEPPSQAVRQLFHAHFDHVVPMLGRAFGSEGPYTYLPESLRGLPGAREMLGLYSAAGFRRSIARGQSLGIVTTYLGEAAPIGRATD